MRLEIRGSELTHIELAGADLNSCTVDADRIIITVMKNIVCNHVETSNLLRKAKDLAGSNVNSVLEFLLDLCSIYAISLNNH